jgi:hypothetical protein
MKKAEDGRENYECGKSPKSESPVGICFVNNEEECPWNEEEGESDGEGSGGEGLAWWWAIRPTFPKEEKGEKGHQPSEGVVRV